MRYVNLYKICNRIVKYQLRNIDTSVFVPTDEILLPILEIVRNCRRSHGLNDVWVEDYTLNDIKNVIYNQRKLIVKLVTEPVKSIPISSL